MKKLIRILEGLAMKKFLLVILIGMVLAINVYGFVNEFMTKQAKEVNHIEETTTMVYVE
jgi:ABC-type Na+ efflux pump permease subunit